MNKSFVYLILPLMILASCANSPIIEKKISARNGEIDIRGWKPESGEIIRISGEAEFYWMQLLSPQDLSRADAPQPTGLISFPGTWHNFKLNGTNLPGKGHATFRLRIRNDATNQVISFLIPMMSSSSKLWFNGRELFTVGKIGTNAAGSQPNFYPATLSILNTSPEMELVFQICNYDDYWGRIWSDFVLGSDKQIRRIDKRSLGWEMLLFGSLFIMGIYHLVLYFIRKKDPSPLYFGVFCILISLRTIVMGQFFVLLLFPQLPLELRLKIEFLCFYLAVPLFISFIRSLFPLDMKKWVVAIFYPLATVYSLVVIFFPFHIYIYMLRSFQYITVIFTCYAFFVVILATIRRREGAAIFVTGSVFLFITVIYDILVANGVFNSGYLISFGLFMFIFSQSFMLALRFSRAFTMVEELSRNLEQKVAERTIELETEKNKLRQRNEEMEKELNIARKIQMQFIPSESPSHTVAFYYRPMETVGGDFFQFVRFTDKKIGFLVSDVSGHGVPAAFVTSLIHSFTLQFSEIIDNPAEFLGHLNDFLLNQTAGNFVTAFYGIYNPGNREIIYANAGHNPPLMVEAQTVSFLESNNKTLPLAVFDLNDMKANRKKLKNTQLKLKKGCRVLFYTDGLTETVNAIEKSKRPEDNLPDFETARLFDILLQAKDLPVEDYVNQIVEQLFAFRGSGEFDDDVCLICLAVE